jgi:hypothetical protein
MSIAASLLAPLLLLLPGGGQGGAAAADGRGGAREAQASHGRLSFDDDALSRAQVRIEQRMTIRIAPRPAPARPDLLFYLPDDEIAPRFMERKMGKCLPVSNIAGVQSGGGSRLILFMRDRRIVSASLERACRARDFYSGFYLSESGDGRLCVDRDTLLSRNGANCKLTRLRQLVEVDD